MIICIWYQFYYASLCNPFSSMSVCLFNIFWLTQNGRHLGDDIFKYNFLNENVWISIKVSLKFLFKCPINNFPASVQIMAWRQSGDKPLSEPMMVNLPMHTCITLPHWVNPLWPSDAISRRSWSSLFQAMVPCLMVPSHYLIKCHILI